MNTHRERIDRHIAKIIKRIPETVIPQKTIELMDYAGIVPGESGSENVQPWINQALKELSESGGGTLHLAHPQAKAWAKAVAVYSLEGSIYLQSNTRLLVDKNIRLQFSEKPEHYRGEDGKGVYLRYEGTSLFSFSPLIYAYNVENACIEVNPGHGAPPVIDGNGQRWQGWSEAGQAGQRERGEEPSYQKLKTINDEQVPLKKRHFCDPNADFFRPTLLGIYFSKNVKVEGVKLKNSPFWVVHPVFSQSLIFRNLEFDCYNVNNDGIDPESCEDVLIENILFGNHDDNIAVKGGRGIEGRAGISTEGTSLQKLESPYQQGGLLNGETRNIVIRHCHFKGHYAFCVGSDLSNKTHSIYVVDNVALQEVGMGIYLKSDRSRGCVQSDIYVDNMRLHHVKAHGICINANYDNSNKGEHPPLFERVYLSNIFIDHCKRAIDFQAWSDRPIGEVRMQNIHFVEVREKPGIQLRNVENLVYSEIYLNGKRAPELKDLIENGAEVDHVN